MKQRKAKEVLGEACGGQDGGRAWRVGRTAEDRLIYSGTNSRRSADIILVGRTAEDRLM